MLNICFQEVSMSLEAEDDGMSLAERRPRRLKRLPKRFQDIVPEPLPLLPPVFQIPINVTSTPQAHLLPASEELRHSSVEHSPGLRIRKMFQSPKNIFGLFRRYFSDTPPVHDPEEHQDLSDLSDEPIISSLPRFAESENPFKPFPNKSSFQLADWHWNHEVQKSRESFNQLLDIVGNPEFRLEDVRQTDWVKIDSKLAANHFDGSDDKEEAEWMDEDAGWIKTLITISVPFHSKMKNPGPQDYYVGDLYHRSFVSVIHEKLAKPQDDRHFHYEPFELHWQSTNTGADERVHGELYMSPAFLDAHQELQESAGEPACNLPRVIVAMMLWSNGTHLTSFGNAKLWPTYLFFGNESKYCRCKPTCHLCNHVTYFQAVRLPFLFRLILSDHELQLPDAFKDFASKNMKGHPPSDALMTHCRREVFQAQWDILLDEEFLIAYEHGIMIECCDEITRRFYPRFFTYSADYKEK
jgi:hypothetical protein